MDIEDGCLFVKSSLRFTLSREFCLQLYIFFQLYFQIIITLKLSVRHSASVVTGRIKILS